ncbi:class I SAM-dependent methyltransferase [Nocardia terpenica]|uniref:S-adenosyl-L-methionine-dependent methyltransferase n=1 Tax=Nocardia terpenica TaxID=455432 RepID=A0A6G9ZA21_9NOCA|nr:class I SAM-dependent methyltransferase [Nocardia terpenica]QIS22459.1 SAM-dependent methyltransferase [Nocardia terpenica]
MQNGEPSRTALSAARYRADHQDLEGGRVFRDPLARAIVGDTEPGGATMPEEMRRRMRLFIALRSRYAEDALAAAVAGGTAQAIVLGAGLDTLAYRNPHPGLRVFEIDHPDTQAWKRERLAAAGIDIPASVTYAPTDFEHGNLDTALAATSFDRSRPAFVIWLGVSIYLTRAAIAETLHRIGRLAVNTRVVLDYSEPVSDLNPEIQAVVEQRKRQLAAIGESWISYFTPAEMADLMHDNGFRIEEDVPGSMLAARYLSVEVGVRASGPHLIRARIPA